MRKIKFRSWIKGKNKMIYDFGILDNNRLNDNGETILMQYTGLRDKNGKEIYEGDIATDGTINYTVAFYMGAWRLKRNVDGDTWWKSLYRYVADCKCEVIGNIYENPELLKN